MNSEQEKVAEFIFDQLAAKGLDQFEIYLMERMSLVIEMKEGEIDFLDNSQGVGLALRTISSGRLGFSYCTDRSAWAVEKAIQSALAGMEHSAPDQFLALPASAGPVPKEGGLYDPSYRTVQEKEKIERARALEAAALRTDKRVKKVRKASYSEHEYLVLVVNSLGINAQHRGTLFSAGVMALASDGDDSQMGWDFDFSRQFLGLQVEKVGSRAATQAVRLLGAKRVSTRSVPLLLENRVAADFLGVLASSFLAESVQKGKSRLAGKLGETIFSPLVNIVDDGLYPQGLATSPVDGEGVPRGRNCLAQAGQLTGFLYDSYCAAKEKRTSTGNSARGDFKTPPRVGITNLYLEKGEDDLQQLLAKLGDGFWVTDVLGMHTANNISLDFSVGCAGFLVAAGQAIQPVKGMAISGNLLEIYSGVQAVGSDLRFFGPVGSPSLVISPVTVSGE